MEEPGDLGRGHADVGAIAPKNEVSDEGQEHHAVSEMAQPTPIAWHAVARSSIHQRFFLGKKTELWDETRALHSLATLFTG